MIEYVYNTIRATAGEDIAILAKVRDAYGDPIPACYFHLFDDEQMLTMIAGNALDDDTWEFIVPAAITKDRNGRHWYCICDENHSSLCFKEAIYLV